MAAYRYRLDRGVDGSWTYDGATPQTVEGVVFIQYFDAEGELVGGFRKPVNTYRDHRKLQKRVADDAPPEAIIAHIHGVHQQIGEDRQ